MNNISVNFEKNSIVMNFLNGTVTVPGTYGGYVIASGCGSGKTTVIKEIIRQKFNEGILYAASTIREVDEMYEWLVNNVVDKPNSYGDILTNEEIIVLHSENEESRYTYRLNPYEITTRKIVLCTHYKLLHDDPEILIKQSFDIKRFRSHTTKIRNSISISMKEGTEYSYPRQWILVDEIPSCDTLKAYFQKAAKISLLDTINTSIKHINEEGIVVCDKAEFRLKGFDSREETMMAYNMKVRGYPYDPFPESANSENENIKSIPAQLRKDLLIDSFIENESRNLDTDDFESIKDGFVRYNISDLILDKMDTRILVFDGTGDLTFGDDNGKFNLRNIRKKYNSNCKFIKIDSSMSRKFKESYLKDNENKILENLNKCCEQLMDIIDRNEKTLIVTWKDLKMINKDKRKRSSIKLVDSKYNSEFNLPNYMKDKLIELGVSKEFSIIHYQSGLDRATNEFKDYDSIVFMGEFHVPNIVVEEFNESYSAKSNQFKYTLYQLVQAICRTRIRNHRGDDINIYMTDDWDNKYIIALNLYLNYNNIDRLEELNSSKPMELVDSQYIRNETLSKLSNKWSPIIKILDEKLFPGLLMDIRQNNNRSITTSLGEIREIYALKNGKVRDYYPLINYLRKFNIDLTILSR